MGVSKDYRPKVSQSSFMPGAFKIEDTIEIALATLTAAQIEAMHGAAVNLFPAPAAGKAIIPVYLVFDFLAGSAAFTGGGVVSFQYHTNTSIAPFNTTIPASVVQEATPGTYLYYLGANAAFAPPLADGIDITNASGAFAAGNGSAKVWMAYRVLTS